LIDIGAPVFLAPLSLELGLRGCAEMAAFLYCRPIKGVLEEGALGIKQLQRLAGLWIVQHLLNEGGGIALPSSAAF
jgi:hypothetical protein